MAAPVDIETIEELKLTFSPEHNEDGLAVAVVIDGLAFTVTAREALTDEHPPVPVMV